MHNLKGPESYQVMRSLQQSVFEIIDKICVSFITGPFNKVCILSR